MLDQVAFRTLGPHVLGRRLRYPITPAERPPPAEVAAHMAENLAVWKAGGRLGSDKNLVHRHKERPKTMGNILVQEQFHV